MSGQRTGGKRAEHQKRDSQTGTGGGGGPSTGGSEGDKREATGAKGSGKSQD